MDHRVLSWQQRHGFALSFALALAVALFAFPIAAHAADEAGNVFSSSSSNPSSIEGDLYWIGRALDLDSATVGRDVLAAGETLDIDNTQVGGSIRTAGKTIDISKQASTEISPLPGSTLPSIKVLLLQGPISPHRISTFPAL